MHLNIIISSILALISLVSARITIISPSSRTIWQEGSKQTLEWRDSGSENNSIFEIYVMCDHERISTVIKDIYKGPKLPTTCFQFTVPKDNIECSGYLIKFITKNPCGPSYVYHSSRFTISSEHRIDNLNTLTCNSDSNNNDKPKLDENNGTKKDETKTQGPSKNTEAIAPPSSNDGHESQTENSHATKPESENAKPESHATETKSTEAKPTKPVPQETGNGKYESNESEPNEPNSNESDSTDSESDSSTSSETGSRNDASSNSPNSNKHENLDSSGSIITFKFLGVILATILTFSYL